MTKKIVITVLVTIVSLLLIWSLTDCAEFKNQEMSFADSLQIRTLLVLDKTDFIEYGCGFSEDYAVKIGGLTYCLAQDDCNSVYIPELDFYYTITEENHQALHCLLDNYS